jgi:glycosyltransferase involved in cell wall biosynthesis
MPPVLHILAWMVALTWLIRTLGAYQGMPAIPNLLLKPDAAPAESPTLTVIVPARNEERDIRAGIESLLAQDYPHLHVIAVNDRSTDETGTILDALEAENPAKLRVVHVETLPDGWLGKTHAMALAAREARTDYLLFTDADVLFAPSALRLSLASAVASRADHFILLPTTIIHRWDEAALLAFFQTFALWQPRPWRVADPTAPDALGIGAFNLLRRDAYEKIGGFEALRMQIVEDLALGRLVKRARLRQRVAVGRGLVSVHWASGVPGLIDVMTKNVFAALNFNLFFALGGCVWLLAFCILPFFGFLLPAYTTPCAVTLASILWAYILFRRWSGLAIWNALLTPFAAAVFVFTLLRSTAITLRNGGVTWRGTFYPLAELREHITPMGK